MLINKILGAFDIRITRKSTFEGLVGKALLCDDYKQQIDILLTSKRLVKLSESKSQMELRQDMFVLTYLDFKRNGYFVEFGVANGKNLSNTWLLEKEFEWRGIVAEPARCWHDSIRANRTCDIDTRCVWKESNSVLVFNEADVGELSTIDKFSLSDIHKQLREKGGNKYEVETISLLDLLDKHKAPPIIDYLSIDTEGSELDILSSFDFDKYQFRVITCEHNLTSRDGIYSLLSSKGYVRVHPELSKCDDWYVKDIAE